VLLLLFEKFNGRDFITALVLKLGIFLSHVERILRKGNSCFTPLIIKTCIIIHSRGIYLPFTHNIRRKCRLVFGRFLRPFKAQSLLHVTPALTSKHFLVCTHSIFMRSIRFSECRAVISLKVISPGISVRQELNFKCDLVDFFLYLQLLYWQRHTRDLELLANTSTPRVYNLKSTNYLLEHSCGLFNTPWTVQSLKLLWKTNVLIYVSHPWLWRVVYSGI
jgi:hypothetical protein